MNRYFFRLGSSIVLTKKVYCRKVETITISGEDVSSLLDNPGFIRQIEK